jgi:hypothetical protein
MISRYAPLFFGLILGIALGLVYGWVISPSEYTGSSPEALREDYRIDFTLMIAKAYSNDNDLAQAKHRLSLLSAQNSDEQALSALVYAREHDFNFDDIETLNQLVLDLGFELTSTETGGE